MSRKNNRNRPGSHQKRQNTAEIVFNRIMPPALTAQFREEVSRQASQYFSRSAYPVRVVDGTLRASGHDESQILFWARIIVDYCGVVAEYSRRIPLRMEQNPARFPDASAREAIGRIPDLLPSWAEDILRDLPSGYTASSPGDQGFEQLFDQVQYPLMSVCCGAETVQSICDRAIHETQTRLQSELLEEMDTWLAKRVAMCQQSWAVPGQAVSVDIQTQITSNFHLSVCCSLGIQYQFLEYEAVTSSGAGFFHLARQGDPEALYAHLTTNIEKLAHKSIRRLRWVLPPAEVRPPADSEENGFPREVWDAITTGNVQVGSVSAAVSRDDTDTMPRMSWVYSSTQNATRSQMSHRQKTVACWSSRCFQVVLRPYAKAQHGRKYEIDLSTYEEDRKNLSQLPVAVPDPGSLPQMLLACAVVNQVYQGLELSGDRPPLVLDFNRSGICRCSWSAWEREFSPAEGEPLEDQIRSVLETVQKAETVFRMERRHLTAFLQELNPIHLQILQHIYRTDRAWYHNILSVVSSNTETSQAAVGRSLADLGQFRVSILGEQQRLYHWECVEGVRLYTPNEQIPANLILDATGRDFCAEELTVLTAEGRHRWLLRQADAAETQDQKWAVLAALEKLPKVTVVSFVRSAPGMAFLRSLTGADAEYARFFLETLPGCKKLASQLFLESTEPDATLGAESPGSEESV